MKRVELVLVVAVLGLAAWLVVPALSRARTAEARDACLANLGQIGRALESYLNDNDQRWPYVAKLASLKLHDPPWPTLRVVLTSYTGDDTALFHCPADRRTLSSDSPLRGKFSATTTWFETEGTSYEWQFGDAYGGHRVGEESLSQADGFGLGRPDQPLLRDFGLFHEGDGGGTFNTLNADLKPRTTRAGSEG
ncbi:MAG: hypothetical protein JXQ75_22740 [Phycisphaerae bacterium]|nr:hypothetical protein [Phycisphaerae bacterium]